MESRCASGNKDGAVDQKKDKLVVPENNKIEDVLVEERNANLDTADRQEPQENWADAEFMAKVVEIKSSIDVTNVIKYLKYLL